MCVCVCVCVLLALHVKLKNAVFSELFRLSRKGGEEEEEVGGVPAEDLKEPLEYIRAAHDAWQSKLRGGVYRLCGETKAVLSKSVREREGV